MATELELIALLREAEQAYHELAIGQAPKVIVHQNGQRVEYNSTTLPRLKAYIQELKLALGYPTAPASPMKVFF